MTNKTDLTLHLSDTTYTNQYIYSFYCLDLANLYISIYIYENKNIDKLKQLLDYLFSVGPVGKCVVLENVPHLLSDGRSESRASDDSFLLSG